MIDALIVAERRQLTGGHAEHRAALEVPRDAQVVARRERVHLRSRAVHDDGDRLRSGREVILEVGAQARMTGGERRRAAQGDDDQGGQGGARDTTDEGDHRDLHESLRSNWFTG